jgi:putative N6-adenine-specific DNA methylase
MAARFPLFVTASKGTEDLLAEELTELGARRVRQARGGVHLATNLHEALHLCLWSRIAMRMLYPLGTFEAAGKEGLYEAARGVAWEEHLTANSTFAVEATLRDSEHTHSGFVALRIKDAIADRLRDKLGARPDVDTRRPDVAVVAHLAKSELSLSLDLCGEPLHRRGYRVRPTVAPLKETLAAALLRAARYDGNEPLVDPMCGSGTLVIEAALLALRRAPSLHRAFAVERWPSLGDQARPILTELRDQARAAERKAPFPIWAFDKSDEAVEAARKNARAARVAQEISIKVGDATTPLPITAEPPGLIISNPPYGDRLRGGQGQKGMKSFYFKLGESLAAYPGWRTALFCGNPGFESAFHRRPQRKRALWNGPIAASLYEYA